MTDDEFLAAFERCSIPKADWTHTAHLRMAWLYLDRLPFDLAQVRIRTGIRRYNESLGNTTGYHDTVTVAFARLVAARRTTGEPFDQFRTRCPELFGPYKELLRRHYSDERLKAGEDEFVEPDRAPLPEVL